jgi:carboxymethylenebutenolidase
VAFAPDALHPLGGYPGDEDKARDLFGKLDQAKTREDFVAAFEWLEARPETTGRVGAVGFCYGGGIQARGDRYRQVGAGADAAGSVGGEGGIRTHDTVAGITVFETVRFNHLRTSPSGERLF